MAGRMVASEERETEQFLFTRNAPLVEGVLEQARASGMVLSGGRQEQFFQLIALANNAIERRDVRFFSNFGPAEGMFLFLVTSLGERTAQGFRLGKEQRDAIERLTHSVQTLIHTQEVRGMNAQERDLFRSLKRLILLRTTPLARGGELVEPWSGREEGELVNPFRQRGTQEEVLRRGEVGENELVNPFRGGERQEEVGGGEEEVVDPWAAARQEEERQREARQSGAREGQERQIRREEGELVDPWRVEEGGGGCGPLQRAEKEKERGKVSIRE